MTEVDQRIVAMHFDNKQFEKGAKETIETLEQLRESLDLEESAESLNTLAESAKDLDFDQAAKSATKLHEALSVVQKVASKTFSVATFPIRALGNALGGLAKNVRKWFGIDLARNIEQAATSAIKSLTIDPLATGWNEYEMKMDSVKTIMTGTSKEFATLSDDEHLGKVKSTLEELNRYADETIYSFKDMTASIGKFTNAGVHLDVAAKSMMGISNLAAQAGQGVQQANMAMYNFSQSLSMGYVEARDWRSIENANMATLDFKETLVDIGVLMGTLKKDSKGVIKTNVKGQKKVAVTAEGIRDSLQYRWLTSDVLTTALEIYSGEMSIEQIMERLPGLTEEQAQALYQVGQEAKEAATQVRTFSKMFDALKEAAQSGWATSWELIFGDLNEATALWTSINDRISAVLNDMAETRNNILLGWRGMTKDKDGNLIKVSDYDGRQDLIDSLMKVFDIVDHIGHAISVAWESVFGKFGSEQLISATKAFSGFISQIAAWIGTFDDPASGANKLAKILKGLFSIIKVLWNITKGFATTIKKIVMPVLGPLIDMFALLGELIYDLVNGQEIGDDLGERFVKSFNALWEGIKKGFADGFSYIKDSVLKLFGINTEEIGRKIEEAGGLHEIIKNTFKSILATLVEWVNYVMSGKAFEDLKIWFSDNWKAIEEAILGKEVWNFKTGKTTRSTPFGRMVFDLIAGFDSAIESIKSGEILSRIQAKFTEIYEGIKKFFVGEDIQTNIENDLGTGFITAHKAGLFDRLLEPLKSGWQNVVDWLAQMSEDVNGLLSELGFDEFRTRVTETFNGIIALFTGEDKQTNIENDLGTGLVSVHTAGLFDRVSSALSSSWSNISTWFVQVNKDVHEFTDNVSSWTGWETISEFFSGVWSAISGWWEEHRPDEGTWPAIKRWFTRVHQTVSLFIQRVGSWTGWETISNFFSGVWSAISGWWEEHKPNEGTWPAIKQWFVDLWTTISNFFTKQPEESGEESAFSKFVSGIWTEIKRLSTEFSKTPFVQTLGTFLTNLWNVISGFLTNVDKETGQTPLSSMLTTIYNDITSFMGDLDKMAMMESLTTKMTELWNSIADILFPWRNSGKVGPENNAASGPETKSGSLIANAAGTLVQEWSDHKEEVLSVTREISGTFSAASESLKSTSSLLDEIKRFVEEIRAKLGEINFGESVSRVFDSISTAFNNFVTNLPDNAVITSISTFFTTLTTDLSGLINSVIEKVNTTGTDGSSVSPLLEAVTGFINGVRTFFTDVLTEFNAFKEDVKEKWENSPLKSFLDNVNLIFGALGDLIGTVVKFATDFAASGVGTVLATTAFVGIVSIIHDILGFVKEGRKILKIAKNQSILSTLPTTILMIAGSIWLIVDALKTLGTMTQEEFDTGLGRFLGAGLAFFLLFTLIKVVTKITEATKAANSALGGSMTGKEKILNNLGQRIIMFAGFFFLIRYALPDLIKSLNGAQVDANTLLSAMAGVVLLVIGVSLWMPQIIATGKALSADPKDALIGILGVLLAVGIVVEGLGLLSELFKSQDMVGKMEYLGAVFGALSGGFKGQEIASMTKGISQASNEIGGVDEGNVSKIGRVVSIIRQINDNLPHDPTPLERFFTGKIDLSQFASHMKSLGEGIRDFRNAISESDGGTVNYDDVYAAAYAIGALVDAVSIAHGIANTGASDVVTILDWFSFDKEGADHVDFQPLLNLFSQMGSVINEGLDLAALDVNTGTLTTAIIQGITSKNDEIAKAVHEALNQGFTNGNYETGEGGGTGGLFDLSNFTSGVEQLTGLMNGSTLKGFDISSALGGIVGQIDFSGLTGDISTRMGGLVTEMENGLNTFDFEKGFNIDTFLGGFTEELVPDDETLTTMAQDMVGQLSVAINDNSSVISTAGRNLVLSFAEGMRTVASVPKFLMGDIVTSMINAAQNAFDQAMLNDFHLTPVITPVVDMNAAKNGMSAFTAPYSAQYLYGSNQLSFNSSVRVPEVKVDNTSNVMQAVNMISARFDTLNEHISQLQMVLDTGALVAHTVDAYDRALGARAAMKSR